MCAVALHIYEMKSLTTSYKVMVPLGHSTEVRICLAHFVRPSVCQMRVDCDKTEERSVQIFYIIWKII